MNTSFLDAKRRVRRELSCINTTLVIIFAAAAVTLGIIFAIGGVDGDACDEIIFPECAFSPFFMCFFFGIAVALFAVSQAIIISTPAGCIAKQKPRGTVLFACALILVYVWIPVMFTAAEFLLGTLLVLIIMLACAALFSIALKINRIAAYAIFAFALWMLYILYFSFALLLLN